MHKQPQHDSRPVFFLYYFELVVLLVRVPLGRENAHDAPRPCSSVLVAEVLREVRLVAGDWADLFRIKSNGYNYTYRRRVNKQLFPKPLYQLN